MKWNIRKKFLFPTLALIVIGMGGSSAISYYKSKDALSTALLGNIVQQSDSTSMILQTWLKDRSLDLASWRSDDVYSKSMVDSIVGKAARVSANEKLTRLKTDYGYYEDITLVDATGLVVASSAEKIIGKLNVKDREYFKTGMAGKSALSDVSSSKNTGNTVFFVSAPIIDKEQVKGVLTGVVNVDSFSKHFIDPVKVGENGYAYIFDRKGLVIAHPDKSKVLKMNLNEFDFGKQMIGGKGGQSGQSGQSGLIEYEQEGARYRAAYKTLGDVGWTVVVTVPETQIMAPVSSLGRLNLLVALVIIGVAAILIFLVTSTVVKPLNQVVAGLRDAAEGEGDLTKRIVISSRDEVGELARWFNSFVEKIQKIIADVAHNAADVSRSSKELAIISEHLTQGAAQTSGKAVTVATASEEMSATIATTAGAMEETSNNLSIVASGAEEMTATINEIAKNTERGRQIAEEAVGQTGHATRQIEELGVAAQQIGKVVETITEISEQVNLLALNATIEAARAGDAGKGFAVVANEIKDLAKQTAAASGEIKQQVEGIQTSTQGTVGEISSIAQVVAKLSDIVTTIATAVEEQSVTTKDIADNVARASQGVNEVSRSIGEGSQTALSIATDIADVTQAAGEMSNASTQVNTSSQALSDLASQLDVMVGQFKV